MINSNNFINNFFSSILFSIFMICSSCKNEIKSPINFSNIIPVDVAPDIQEKLKMNNDNFYYLNKEFNKFSWQSFIAIFWPLNPKGEPLNNFTDKGNARWTSWKEAYEVFKCDGEIPDKRWGSERSSHRCILPDKKIKIDKIDRLYLESKTPAHKGGLKNFADEENQAFAGKLYDQNGNKIYYEALMNKVEFDYIMSNKLYNINGQIEFAGKKNQIANFPWGDYKANTPGSIEIKIAWKILLDTDLKERYFSSYGYIPDDSGKEYIKVELGMIGLHIGQKTPTTKQWVWSTFEHIDNLSQNTIQKDGKELVIKPSLTNPNCELCPVNLNIVDSDGKPSSVIFNKNKHSNYWTIKGDKSKTKYYADSEVFKTQAKRIIDIPNRVQQINQEIQSYLKSIGSVFQYYKLIDTQYPTNQEVPPGNNSEDGYTLPESVANKTGGNPNLAYLTNITMETFFQKGNQPATHLIETMPKSDITIYGSESCMGCHSSAPIYNGIDEKGNYTTKDQLSGDFSWLLQRAEWNQKMLNPN